MLMVQRLTFAAVFEKFFKQLHWELLGKLKTISRLVPRKNNLLTPLPSFKMHRYY